MDVHCSLWILLILLIFKNTGVDIKCFTEIFNVKLFYFFC